MVQANREKRMDDIIAQASEEFSLVFGDSATAYGEAPGRVEVIGNHTDYNDGFIVSAAINRRIVVVGRPVDGTIAKIHSMTFHSGVSFDIADPVRNEDAFWVNYMIGVVSELKKRDIQIGGFEALVAGDVPQGAGLSSSAALEVATAMFLKEINGFAMNPIDMALCCQAAENKFVGVNCGILDQFTSVMGRKDRLVFLDCRHLADYDYLPLGSGLDLVIADTRAPHRLMDGAYNRLRESCFHAARICAELFPEKKITHLRDVTLEELDVAKSHMSSEDYHHAKHIVSEDERVKKCAEALNRNDPETMGRLMTESHTSSRVDFGNSSPELDIMVEEALKLPGCYGARLNGGGFGGATINLVREKDAADFASELNVHYYEKTKIQPEMHLFHAGEGALGGKLSFKK